MSRFRKAAFLTTVADLSALPTDSQREVTFAGRSNAGKSSAINALAQHTRLAYVSKTPGRTQHLNFFGVAPGRYFVDLPGYGFAKAPEEIRAQWEGLLAPYLEMRSPLVGLVLIMDSRLPLTDLDRQMIEWFQPTGETIHVLLTKADKLTRQEQADVLRDTRAALAGLGETCSVQLFSSLKRTGISEAETVLGEWLDMPAEPASGTTLAPGATGKAPRPKDRKAIGWSARSAQKSNGQKQKAPGKGVAGGKMP